MKVLIAPIFNSAIINYLWKRGINSADLFAILTPSFVNNPFINLEGK